MFELLCIILFVFYALLGILKKIKKKWGLKMKVFNSNIGSGVVLMVGFEFFSFIFNLRCCFFRLISGSFGRWRFWKKILHQLRQNSCYDASENLWIYIYVSMCVCIYTYIYMYMYRENFPSLAFILYIFVFIKKSTSLV